MNYKSKISKIALKIAKNFTANNEVSELENLLKNTLSNIENGEHCWYKMPSGNYFTTEPFEEDGINYLCCYINEKVDALGYPSGEMLIDLGSITEESQCHAMAVDAFECDKEFESVWQVWSLDTWGNEEDGWDVNDRRKAFTFNCSSENEKDIQQAFEQALKENGYRIIPFEYDWFSEDNCGVNDSQTGKYLFEFEKE